MMIHWNTEAEIWKGVTNLPIVLGGLVSVWMLGKTKTVQKLQKRKWLEVMMQVIFGALGGTAVHCLTFGKAENVFWIVLYLILFQLSEGISELLLLIFAEEPKERYRRCVKWYRIGEAVLYVLACILLFTPFRDVLMLYLYDLGVLLTTAIVLIRNRHAANDGTGTLRRIFAGLLVLAVAVLVGTVFEKTVYIMKIPVNGVLFEHILFAVAVILFGTAGRKSLRHG